MIVGRLKRNQVVAFRDEPVIGVLVSFVDTHGYSGDAGWDLVLINTVGPPGGYTGKPRDVKEIYEKTAYLYHLIYDYETWN